MNLINNSNEASNANNSSNSLNDQSSGSNNGSLYGNTNLISSINNKNAPVSILKQEHLLNCLSELFYSIVTMKKKKGIIQPKKFIARLRKDNGKDTFFTLYFRIVVIRVMFFLVTIRSLKKHLYLCNAGQYKPDEKYE